MNDEIREILTFLQGRDDYAIWAGFAQFIHLGFKHSADIDIYVKTPGAKEEIGEHFVNRGWDVKQKSQRQLSWDTLEKNKMTFDVVYTPESAELIVPHSEGKEVYGFKVKVISKEWLFFTKLGQISWSDRSAEKRQRDAETIEKLRDVVDIQKIKMIAAKLPKKYWRYGAI
jgi:hypothetical protein